VNWPVLKGIRGRFKAKRAFRRFGSEGDEVAYREGSKIVGWDLPKPFHSDRS